MSESPRKRRKESNQRTKGFLQNAKLLDTCNIGQKLLFLEHNWTVARALKVITCFGAVFCFCNTNAHRPADPWCNCRNGAVRKADHQHSTLFQELGQRHIFSAPLIIKPDLEDVCGSDDRPEPSFLGWIDVTTILQSFFKSKQCQRHLCSSHSSFPYVQDRHILVPYYTLVHMTGLHQQHKQGIPDNMLQLMPLLEAEGKSFANKSLINIAGSLSLT